jgi:hypothetical protein
VIVPLGERFSLSMGLLYSPLHVVRPPRTARETDELLNFRAMISYAFP